MNGFQVVSSHSLTLDSGKKFAQVTPGEIYKFCQEHWNQEADGLFISCMNFNAMPCIDILEKDLGKPVLTSQSATLWNALRMIGVRDSIPGFGKLLAGGFYPSERE